MDYKAIAEQVGPRVGATQEWIFHVLREGIVGGKLPGGMQLKQDEISAALNVSHIPVREALRRLEAQGLVRIHPKPRRGGDGAHAQRTAGYDGSSRDALGHDDAKQRAAFDQGGF